MRLDKKIRQLSSIAVSCSPSRKCDLFPFRNDK